MRNIYLIGILFVCLSSCGNKMTHPQEGGDTLSLKYATLLNIVDYDGYSVATISNPWREGKILHTYVLVPRESEMPEHLPSGTIIRTPIQRATVFTTVHCSLLTTFGLGERIVGVADLKYIKIPYIHEQVKNGRIADCGNGLSPTVEKIMDIKPDAIMLSPFENSGGYGKVEELGIPLIECAEYMEVSPLARAEWMRFYGLLFGVPEKADSLFNEVDHQYLTLKAEAKQMGKGRSVIIDKMVGSVWYVPGGRSTIGQMLKDAGGQYPWAEDEHSGSLSLPFESVLERAGDADVWMYRYSSDHLMNYAELLSEHRGYNQLTAFKQHHVYGCNVEHSLFYEEAPFRPDYLLSDFIQIVHPESRDSLSLRYYQQLQ